MLDVGEDIGGGMIDRHVARAGHRIGRRAGMDGTGFEAGLAGMVHDLAGHRAPSFWRLLEMMRELKPPQESSPCRRPYSILGQRFMTTVRPAASAFAAAVSLRTPSCIHNT